MAQVLQAIYENGVLRPLERLDLDEHQRVRLTLEPVASASDQPGRVEPGDPLEGLQVPTGIPDLAEHFDDYRFGRRQP